MTTPQLFECKHQGEKPFKICLDGVDGQCWDKLHRCKIVADLCEICAKNEENWRKSFGR